MPNIKWIEQFVDRFGRRGIGIKKRSLIRFIGGFTISFLLFSVLLLPLFQGKNGLEVLQDMMQKAEKQIKPVGDVDPPAYDYWYAPEHSFGIKETKSVNWSYFKSLFNAHTDWILEYKRYSWSSWTEGNEYLSVDKTWNETGFWKINLTFTAPVDVYEARFTFGCDLVVLDYVEKDGYEVWLNYSANETEVYNMMFNWSDLKQYEGMYFNKGVTDDLFWFRFGKQGIPKGEYVFDPSFGYTDTPTTRVSFNDDIIGSAFVCPTNCNADNMSFFIDRFDTGEIVKCIIYNNSTKELVADTETETGGTLDDVWLTLDFTESPSLNSGVEYLLCVWADSAVSAGVQSGEGIYYKANYIWSGADPDPENPLTVDFSNTYILGIYCSYTEAGGEPENNAPSSTNEAPTNNTDCVDYVAGGRTLYANVTDADGDTMNVTWISNSSGSWVEFAKNSSVSSGTNISQKNVNFTTDNTVYYWNLLINDGNGSIANDSYYFKICENETLPNTWGLNYSWNWSFSNTSRGFNEPISWNFSFSNTSRVFLLPVSWNFSFSNTTRIHLLTNSWNWSFSNTSRQQHLITSFNFSFSNTSISYHNFSWNFSFSNTSRTYLNTGLFNFSWSNTSRQQHLITSFNFSFSNTSISYHNFSFNFSFSNTSRTHNTIHSMYWNFSFSNTTGEAELFITGEHPADTTSIPYIIPTLYFTINSTTGLNMNYTIYWGTDLSLSETLNISNSNLNDTYYHPFSNASSNGTTYYWSVNLTDTSNNWVNETYSFSTRNETGKMMIGSKLYPVILLFAIVPIVLFFLGYKKRKEKKYRRY